MINIADIFSFFSTKNKRKQESLFEKDPLLFTSTLRTSGETYLDLDSFKVGDLVLWKPHLRNKLLPKEQEPAIVLEVLTEPIFDKNAMEDSGNPFFMEPLNLKLGIIDDEGKFLIFYYDSRRFHTYQK